MQPANMDSGAGGHSHNRDNRISDYDVPRLGEIPVRSKYYRPDQEKSHFANHPTYLPLAEQCGPPQPSSSTSLTPRQERDQEYTQSNDDEVSGHAYGDIGDETGVQDDDCEQAQQMLHNSHLGRLCESSVSGTQGSGHCTQTASVGSNASGASSIGPTGLPLMPQFRWIPKQGGGGLGFNPFMHFRSRTRHESMASRPSAPVTEAPMPWNEAQQQGDCVTPELPRGATSPERQQRHNEDQSQAAGRQNSYSMFYGCTSQPPAQQSAPLPFPHRETGALSFYGPIGSIGIETSRKRRAVERQSGTDGEAERVYKERSSRRPVEGEETGVQLLTQLWCDVSLLRGARVVDSPRLHPDDGEGDDSASTSSPSISDMDSNIGDREAGEAAMAARKKVRQRRQQYSSWSPSFYFKDDDLAALGAEDNRGGSPSGAAARAAPVQMPVTVRAHHQQHNGPSVVRTASPAGAAGDQREVGGVDKVAVRGVAGHELASSSSSSGSSDNDSSDDGSNSAEGSAGERSACFGSDRDDDESADSDDADNPRSSDNDAAADSTHPRRWKKHSSAVPSAGTGRSVLRDGQYDFMNSSLMDESFMSRMPGCGAGMSLLYACDDYDGGGEEVAAAAAADLVPNHAPHRVCAQSAGIAGANMAPHPPTSPSIPTQSQEHRGSSSMPVARGSAVRPSGSGTAATLALRSQRRVSNATDTRAPSTAAGRHIPHQGGEAGSSSNHNAGGGNGGCGLGEQFAYGSTFGMGSRRNSYSATASDEAHNATFTSLSVYWVTKGNGNTVSPGTSVMGGDDEASAIMGVYSDSRDSTVSPGLLGVTSRGPTTFLAVDGGCTAKTRNSTSQPSKSPLTDRGVANPAAHSRPPSTAQGAHEPVVLTFPKQSGRKVKAVYPGGYLAPITPPITPKANEAPLPRRAQSNNGSASTPGLGDTVGGKSFTSLAYELPGI
ncbi:hypothetical protein LMJF_20_1050 [Leishmania major strain Friedlin]|uniref:Uncharacterized protein n=1 Tax=Leishmania major TaxID=5664 RepID=Q4QCU1_LEIMA|nr:hypothetical protein LMJF_20_1050 [Leishmania major strain Friedlin]CAG9573175.1 hypothetical_protein_-_conserved [Leishmania major strain Friedlin]CAJ04094.1 hypothetical protein LMJF_20_1050 [Leishmania major strain Friedlin]|eukprot:XP_001682857.1 hypothetical protein LMJF_20_1050 [Leishmania major strain Friedlin]